MLPMPSSRAWRSTRFARDFTRISEGIVNHRIERDTMGEMRVPADRYYGAHRRPARSSTSTSAATASHATLIRALGVLKKAAASCQPGARRSAGRQGDAHRSQAADEVIAGKLDDHFPLVVWQTGSGTQTNMNANEVIANRAIELAGGDAAAKKPVHPNDDVNMSQSSNDTFPTAMHIAAAEAVVHRPACPRVTALRDTLRGEGAGVRGHREDRPHAPAWTRCRSRWGRSSRGYVAQLDYGLAPLERRLPTLYELALGGTAVGTGLNAHPEFAERVAKKIAELTGLPFVTAPNKFEALAGARRARASRTARSRRWPRALMKIANDVRWLARRAALRARRDHDPRERAGLLDHAGQGEPDAVRGDDDGVRAGDGQRRRGRHRRRVSGNFELNVFKPVIIHNFLHSVRLLADACRQLPRALRGGHRAEPRAHRRAPGALADARDGAEPAHRLRQRRRHRQEGPQGGHDAAGGGARPRPAHRRAVHGLGRPEEMVG